MPANAVTVTLGEMSGHARRHLDSGRYASMSEVVRAGLRALDALLRARVAEALADPRPSVPLADGMAAVRDAGRVTGDVRLGPLAVSDPDLVALHRCVKGKAGQQVADAYLDRVEVRIATLADLPARGTPRHDLAPGLWTLAFERRLVIAYAVAEDAVTILRVVSGARDLGASLGAEPRRLTVPSARCRPPRRRGSSGRTGSSGGR